MREKLLRQIKAIRNTGKANMFDINTIRRFAQQLQFKELVDFLTHNEDNYIEFIMTGNEELLVIDQEG